MSAPVTGAPPKAARRSLSPYLVVVAMVAVMWIEEVVDLLPHTPFDGLGIRPRRIRGLLGLPLSPLLHADFGHLIGNTIPFLVLGCLIAASGTQRLVQVTVITGLIAGIGTWLIGPSNTVHIGASGIVFGYMTYLVARGAFERNLGHLLLGLLVFFFYGSLLWGVLPRPGISWQGHLFGAVGGVVAAWTIRAKRKAAPARPIPSPAP